MDQNQIDQTPSQETSKSPDPITQTDSDTSTKPVKAGYLVGLGEDGSLKFEILGDKPGLIELLGLHKFAEQKMMLAHDLNQETGLPLLVAKMNAMLRGLEAIWDSLHKKPAETTSPKVGE